MKKIHYTSDRGNSKSQASTEANKVTALMEWALEEEDYVIGKAKGLWFLNNNTLSDVTLIVPVKAKEGEPTKMAIPAHKVLLSLCSPVFFSMFCGKMRLNSDIVELMDCEYEGVLVMLQYMYTGELELTENNVMDVLHVAKKYLLNTLVEDCINFLSESIDPDNVFCILSNALLYDDDRILVKECWDLIDTKTEEAVKSEAFGKIERSLLDEVVKRDSLTIKEIELFKAIDFWAGQACERQGLTPDGNVKRRVLGDSIVEKIRFPVMEEKEFASVVLDSEMLKQQELVKLMKYFNSVLTTPLNFQEEERAGAYLSCFRFDEVGDEHRLRGVQAIQFYANKDIVLHGIRLFGSKNNEYDVTLTVKEIRGDVMITKISKTARLRSVVKNSPFSFYGRRGNYCTYSGFDVMFDPLYMIKRVRYSIAVNLNGSHPTCCGLKGSSIVGTSLNVTFFFIDCPNSTTTSKSGQFADFLFRLP